MLYDIVVIGGGPAGYPAVIRARQLGMRVALVEKESVGGICLNWGCIPTKALLHVAEKYLFIKNHAKDLAINCSLVELDFAGAISYSRSVVKKLTSGIDYLLKKNNVDVFKDTASITKDKKIALKNSQKLLDAKNIVIATGTSPKPLRGLEFDHEIIWDYKDAMTPKNLPSSILIVGSGAIGIEFASIYNSFGTDVTVIEMQKNILPTEDLEISTLAHKIFAKSGIKIYTETTVESLKKHDTKAEIVLSNKEKITPEKILVAAGVVANSSGLGVENFPEIKLNNGFIQVNDMFETGCKNISAIGDVSGPPCLAHKATHEAILCINRIAGKKITPIKKENIPSCIYSFPQIASIGMKEEEAINRGYEIKVGRVKSESNGKSVATGKKDGLVKTIFDKKTGELLGAHMIGHEVTEMIQGYVIAKGLEATDESIKEIIFPHPTVSEMMYESVLAADGEDIHS